MSTFTIPNSNGQTRQNNRSDTFGELVETFNINLNKKFGKIHASKQMLKVLDETDDLEDEIVSAFAIYESNYYIVTTGDTWKCSVTSDPTDSTNWSKVTAITVGEDFETDAVVFGGLLLISTSTDIASWNNSADDADWWTAVVSGSALTNNYPHMMHVHRGGAETLFVTDQNKVRYYNADAGHSTVTLQTDFVASCVNSGVNAIWVGTYTESGANAYVYEIYTGETTENGTPKARNAYKVEGRAVLAIEVVDNIPYIVTEKGNIQAFNGAGFSTVASFPFANSDEVLSGVRAGQVQDSSKARPVHPKGMQLHNDSLYININTDLYNTTDLADKSPSGIWEFNKTTGQLNHRYAFANTATDYGALSGDESAPLMIVDGAETLLMAGFTTKDATGGMFAESTGTPKSFFVTSEIDSGTV